MLHYSWNKVVMVLIKLRWIRSDMRFVLKAILNGVKHEYLDSTRLILTILEHYLSISMVLDLIWKRIPTIDFTWVLTWVLSESASFWQIAIAGWVIRRSLVLIHKVNNLKKLIHNDSTFKHEGWQNIKDKWHSVN